MKHLPTLIGLVVTMGRPIALTRWSDRILGDPTLMRTRVASQLALCVIAALVLVIVLAWELPLKSIGLRARLPLTLESACDICGPDQEPLH